MDKQQGAVPSLLNKCSGVLQHAFSDHIQGLCGCESRLAQDDSITMLNRVAVLAGGELSAVAEVQVRDGDGDGDQDRIR